MMGVPFAAMSGWFVGPVAFASPGGTMLREEPVSTRKYFLELASKTWRSELLVPVDKLFTVDRVCRFPAPKRWCVFLSPRRYGTCREGDRILPDRQTSNGIYINRVEVAIVGLTWRQDVGPQDYVPQTWSQGYVPQTCGTQLKILVRYLKAGTLP